MLSFQAIASSSQAAHYFESADDYYAKEGHRGEWLGEGAAVLGLNAQDQVDRATFKNLLDGKLPNGLAVRLSHLRKDDRKGMDYTFSAPKSVSLQALLADDPAVRQAHDAAVRRAVQQLEKLAYARIKERGRSYRVRTGTIVAAAFRHELSRAQDPQLHTHVVVANLTQRPDGQWRALSNDDIQRNVKALGAYYRASLAEELRSRNYALRETGNGYWELAHIADPLLAHFSTRSQQIETAFADRGLERGTVPTALAQSLTLMTRAKKTEHDRSLLREEWILSAQSAGLDLSALDLARQGGQEPDSERLGTHHDKEAGAAQAVDFAIAHLAERQGLFSRTDLVTAALTRGSFSSSIDSVMQEVKKAEADGRLVRELPLYQPASSINASKQDKLGQDQEDAFMDAAETQKLTRNSWVAVLMHTRSMSEDAAREAVDKAISKGTLVRIATRYTTLQGQKIERQLLAIECAGRGQVAPIQAAARLQERLLQSGLNTGQRDAVEMILGTHNRFVAIQGYAGTGKSHMLDRTIKEIVHAAALSSKSEGYSVLGLAPYGSQVNALRELGVESKTLTSFLSSRKEQARLGPRTVVLLDEAGVVPAHQLAQIMRLVETSKARMVLLGDRKQTGAIEAGKPFVQLQDAGMTQVHLREILRQKTPELKAAVLHAAGDETSAALDQLAARTVEVRDSLKRHKAIAHDFVQLPEQERPHTLIVSGTNEARREINALIREGLQLCGGRKCKVLEHVDATRAQLKLTATYATPDLVVVYHRDGQSVQRDMQYTVSNVGKDTLALRDTNGNTTQVCPGRQFAASLYTRTEIDIAPGDVLRISKNDRARGLLNGDRVKVETVSERAIVVRTPKGAQVTLPTDLPLHIQHGYATTVHSAQGLTARRVLIDVNTASLTTHRAAFYVAISRPQYDLKLYADDGMRLRSAVARIPKKFAALELRTPFLERQVVNQRHHEIGITRLRKLTEALQRASPVPTPADAQRSVAFGRKLG